MNFETIRKREENNVFKLLMVLGSDYENLLSSILMMQPLPTLDNVYTIL